MLDFFSLFVIGITAFIASNIDDTFILILLFSSLSFETRQIFIGQFLGFGALIIISAIGSLISLVLPPFLIGLMGLIPIAIGIKRLVEDLRRNGIATENKTFQQNNRRIPIQFLTVSGITVLNGGDDIGVFTPIFAKYNTATEVTILVTIFMVMTFFWCMFTYYIVNHPLIATRTERFGNIITPFILIGIGIYILTDGIFI